MDDQSSFQRNPWTDDDRSLGCLRNVLFLAERTGHLKRVNTDVLEARKLEATEKFQSMKMMSLMQGIKERRSKIDKINLETQCRLQDKETQDLTHVDVLESRISHINAVNEHLQNVISQKDQLISRLQQPFVGDFLKIDANYQKFVSELFPQIVPILAELSSQLDTIEWAANVDMNDGKLESLLTDISSTLAVLQSRFQSLCQLRESTQQLHLQQRNLQT